MKNKSESTTGGFALFNRTDSPLIYIFIYEYCTGNGILKRLMP